MNQQKILKSLRDRVESMELHYQMAAMHVEQGKKEADKIMSELKSMEGVYPSDVSKKKGYKAELSLEEIAQLTAKSFKRRGIPIQ